MQTHDAGRVDQYVTATLIDIAFGFMQRLTFAQRSQVDPPAFRPPDIPKRCREHPVATIDIPAGIDQQWPGQPGLLDVLTRKKIVFERYDRDADVGAVELVFLLAQLRKMPPAGESTEVAVKDQQQPVPPVIFKPVGVPGTVVQGEGDGGLAGQCRHGVPPLLGSLVLAPGSDFGGFDGVCRGLEDHTRLPALVARLHQAGYPAAAIAGIMGENWRRYDAVVLPSQ